MTTQLLFSAVVTSIILGSAAIQFAPNKIAHTPIAIDQSRVAEKMNRIASTRNENKHGFATHVPSRGEVCRDGGIRAFWFERNNPAALMLCADELVERKRARKSDFLGVT